MSYWSNTLLYLSQGARTSVLVMFTTLVLSIPLSILFAYLKFLKLPMISSALHIYTWLIRGTPLLLQLYFTMYGLPLILPIRFSRITVGIITFAINYTAYLTEIFLSGFQSVSKGQWEASTSLGVSKFDTLLSIVLPQATAMVLPTLANETITLIKDTSLLAAIAIGELLRNAREIVSRDLRIDALILAAGIYLMFTYGILIVFQQIKRRFMWLT